MVELLYEIPSPWDVMRPTNLDFNCVSKEY